MHCQVGAADGSGSVSPRQLGFAPHASQGVAHSKSSATKQHSTPQAIRAAVPDIFPRLGKLEQQYRNPCFHDDAAPPKLRCLPYFSIIGVSKCGTTDLHAKLAGLPTFKQGRNKGPHFWDEDHPFKWYLDIYDDVAAAVQSNPKLVTLDASSNTFTYTGIGIRGKPNDAVRLPEVLRAVQPGMRLVLMLRNPVDRIWSSFWYYGCMYGIYARHDMSAEGFHKWVEGGIAVMRSCVKAGMPVQSCAVKHFVDAQQLVKGMYSAFMPDWLNSYRNGEEIFVINTDRYFGNEVDHIRDVVEFLGVEQPSEQELAAVAGIQANRGHPTNPNIPGCEGQRPDMLPLTRALLETFYHPWNEALSKMLEEGSYNWPTTSDAWKQHINVTAFWSIDKEHPDAPIFFKT